GLELLEPPGFGLERGEEGVEIGRGLAEAQLDVTQLVARTLELRRKALERRHRAFRQRDETGCAFAVVRSESCGCRRRCGAELDAVPVALALGGQLLFVPGLETFGVLDQRPQLREPSLGERCVRRQLLLPAPGRLKLAPRGLRGGAARELLFAAEAVDDL